MVVRTISRTFAGGAAISIELVIMLRMSGARKGKSKLWGVIKVRGIYFVHVLLRSRLGVRSAQRLCILTCSGCNVVCAMCEYFGQARMILPVDALQNPLNDDVF